MRKDQFDRLYSEHAAGLFGFVVYRTGNRALAEDIVGETFARALRARGRFDPGKAPAKSWLYGIALNYLRDQQRRDSAEMRALGERINGEPEQEDQQQWLSQLEARESVSSALKVLSDEEREAIALRFGGDLTIPEVAALTGRSVTTIEGRVYRALRKMRAYLGASAVAN